MSSARNIFVLAAPLSGASMGGFAPLWRGSAAVTPCMIARRQNSGRA